MQQDVQQLLLASGWPREMVKEYTDKLYQVAPQAQEPFVSVKGLSKGFQGNPILANVSFDVYPGEVFGIIGKSGSGKTTLLNLLVGFLQPDAGDVVISTAKGMMSMFKHPETRQLFGFASQAPSFYSNLTCEENIHHFAKLYKIKDYKKISAQLLKLISLEEKRKTRSKNLSGGEQKRLDIACALVHDPKVLVLDEPTADLDPLLSKQVWELVKQVNARGTTIILASHVVGEVEDVCTRIGVLRRQTLVDIGTPAQLRVLYAPFFEVRIQTTNAQYAPVLQALGLRAELMVQKIRQEGTLLIITTRQPEHTLDFVVHYFAQQKQRIVKAVVQQPRVEDVFEALVNA